VTIFDLGDRNRETDASGIAENRDRIFIEVGVFANGICLAKFDHI